MPAARAASLRKRRAWRGAQRHDLPERQRVARCPRRLSGGTVTRKQAVTLGVRIAVSAAMLAVLVAQVPSFDTDELVPKWSAGTAAWLGVAAVLTLGGILLSALRWQKVLEALEISARLPRLVSHYMAGQF